MIIDVTRVHPDLAKTRAKVQVFRRACRMVS